MDALVRIKRLVLQGRFEFTSKAWDEMERDGLFVSDVVESIVNAQAIAKTLRSRSRQRRSLREKLYVLKSFDYSGRLIYTKGAIVDEAGSPVFYIFVAAKVATFG